MKYAADFRKIARDSLKGRWVIAIVAFLIAAMLGGVAGNGSGVELEYSENGASVNFEIGDQVIYSTGEGTMPWLEDLFGAFAAYVVGAGIIMTVFFFVLGSIIGVGYARFNLDLVDGEKAPAIGTLFGYFSHWKNTLCTRLLRTFYVACWTLLLIIPGIVAGYSYAMTDYILAEHPELSASEAIARSKEMMAGNRWRLFCLELSFIGWGILSALTMGIGELWLTPYKQAANAAFYREVSGTERIVEAI